MAIKKYDTARIVTPVVQGVVNSIKFDEDTGEKKLLLVWTDGDGATQERWFKEPELEFVSSPVPPDAPAP